MLTRIMECSTALRAQCHLGGQGELCTSQEIMNLQQIEHLNWSWSFDVEDALRHFLASSHRPEKGQGHGHTHRKMGANFFFPFQFAKVIKFRFPLLHPCDQIPRKVLRVHPNFPLAVQLEDVVFANVAA